MGVDAATEQQKVRYRQSLGYQQNHRASLTEEVEEDDGELYSTPLSGETLVASWPRPSPATDDRKIDLNDLFEKRWSSLRAPEQPRRRRGLLAQTIHEESSESDFS